ncbi:MAG: phytoene/squalene synthase family protein [Phycisphaerales bacterium]|nr:phytoene/squalene synthase family protein [Phycisphaerales bacterium]
MNPSLQEAVAACEAITRERAKNFHYGLRLTPPDKRWAMYAVYAWMREADDLVDDLERDPNERNQRLQAYRDATDAALDGHTQTQTPALIALTEASKQFRLVKQDFHDMLDGQVGDLSPAQFQSWPELRKFCYQVAGTVGLVCIRIWGYRDEDATKLAVERGIAFQLTNILRDLREDLDSGRCYLPKAEFQALELTPEMVRDWSAPDRCVEFIRAQCERARAHYDRSAALDAMIDQSCLPTLWAMTEIYKGVLSKIEADPQLAVHGRARLSTLRKVWIALRAKHLQPQKLLVKNSPPRIAASEVAKDYLIEGKTYKGAELGEHNQDASGQSGRPW